MNVVLTFCSPYILKYIIKNQYIHQKLQKLIEKQNMNIQFKHCNIT